MKKEELYREILNRPNIQIFEYSLSRKMETGSPGGRIAEPRVSDLQSKRVKYNESKKK